MAESSVLRLFMFVGVFIVCAMWEFYAPRRALSLTRWLRWTNNLGLVGFNTLSVMLFMPLVAVDVAMLIEQSNLGVMHWLGLPLWLNIFIAVVILDLAIYGQHVLFHFVPWLWRLHRVHHADQDIDVTTGVRFHVLEIVLSLFYKITLVAVLGVSVWGVIVFEILLNASAMFNHSNGRLSNSWDAALRRYIVTPDMHRVHHSTRPQETHSNFGFCLSIWDRFFHTYVAQPKCGHQDMQIGLPIFRVPREQRVDYMLTQPFRRPK